MNEFDMLNDAYFRNASFLNYPNPALDPLMPQSNMNSPMIQQPIKPTQSTQNLYQPMEAYERGTLFPELFQPYKNYMPYKMDPTNEREQLLNNVNAYGFVAHELNLYLDVNPTNSNYIRLFTEYSKKADELAREYEKKYGPLVVSSSTTSPWAWNKQPWPWQKQ